MRDICYACRDSTSGYCAQHPPADEERDGARRMFEHAELERARLQSRATALEEALRRIDFDALIGHLSDNAGALELEAAREGYPNLTRTWRKQAEAAELRSHLDALSTVRALLNSRSTPHERDTAG